MARIIDCGNGYGRVRGYASEYGSLTFPLNRSSVSRLCAEGYLSRDEAIQSFLDLGYTIHAAKWFASLATVGVEQWKAGVERARTI